MGNAAGITDHCPLLDASDTAMERIFAINTLGPLRLTRLLLPELLSGKGGSVCFVASVAARAAFPWQGGYSATKHAVVGMVDTIRREAKSNRLPLRVTIVEPGPVLTPMATM